ncbi:carbohydrate ABC transporter substrate-binding protein [Clostridium botulinum]|uniref:Sugar ABC transporter substrate-binding protein n=1 Tax=Clostridium botulinum C/D str. DC5 TaxID=1443128 RepID=A0A0A0IJ04_CLOBO|nr:ABC transporter substrate-binding protein [Clostridium botulinum]KGN00574.1 sugar ABC transporter substrate-binding protein [Clostridium botulinum C/D str. DC5]KOC53654.1 sugar ABC transporter substrate-binding protein [Clostridium botulinum]KOC55154.1 sugar ABC transporter substrate-binding protein [Clostridium botulinum]MCD3233937.1 carbohydrate ABC transporter substrate-binding protein [Clostridium botulinum D/C]MCD3239775.1 carbohydrate ABC transporter substrate-binding protein [Clostri
MRNVKRIVAFAVTSMMMMSTLVLGGCSSKSQGANSGKKDAVTLNVFQFKVEIAKELEEAAKKYSEKHPEVKINISTVGGGDDYGAALRAKIQSGEEPAIFNIGGPQDVKDWRSRLVDLSGESWVKQSLNGVLDGVTEDKKIYGMPFDVEAYGLVYNKAIFKDAGIDATTIKDYATLEAAVKKLDSEIKSGKLKKKYPQLEAVFEMPAKETWITGLHSSSVALSQEFKSSLDAFKADKVAFKHGDGLKSLIDLEANYSPNAKSKGKLNAVDYATQVGQGIAIERVAIVQQGNWIFNDVNKTDKDVAKNLDMLPIAIKGGKGDSVAVGVPMYWGVNNKVSKEQQSAAKDFLNWLYTSEEGKNIVVNKFFFIPPFKGYEKYAAKDSLGVAVGRYIKENKTLPWVFMGYPTDWGMGVVGKDIQKYLAGEITWDQVIKDSQTQWTTMRNKK